MLWFWLTSTFVLSGFLPIYSKCRRSRRTRLGRQSHRGSDADASSPKGARSIKRQTKRVTWHEDDIWGSEDGSFLDATLSWLAAPAGDRLNCGDRSPHAYTESTEWLNEQQDGWVTATQPLTARDFISATYKIWWHLNQSPLYVPLSSDTLRWKQPLKVLWRPHTSVPYYFFLFRLP